MKLTRWLVPAALAIMLSLALVTPVAAIGQPDSLSIDGVYVYRNCREAGDQLYLVPYTIDYAALPAESAQEAYMLRLMDGDDVEGYAYPYAYHDDGYGQGVVALYFDADEAPTWEGVYTMQLIGNPFADWVGGVPEDEVSSVDFDVWQDTDLGVTQTIVGARVIEMAVDLETAWSRDMVTVADDGKQVLTTYGAGYFVNVIPNCYEIAPDIFAAGQGGYTEVMDPEYPAEETRVDYSDELEANIIGTPFDFTTLAAQWGTSRGALTAILYYGFVVATLIIISRRIGTYKPMMLLSIPFVFLGAFIGVPLIVTVLAGLAGLGVTAYVIFYKPRTA